MRWPLHSFGLVLVLASCMAGEALINRGPGGLAIQGYDAVAYFSGGRPHRGVERFSAEHAGALWLFSSAQNRDLFLKTPNKYAPRYGGYCAFAMADDSLADIDPRAFRIIDGALYLNYDADVQKRWEADAARMIKSADAHWARRVARMQGAAKK